MKKVFFTVCSIVLTLVTVTCIAFAATTYSYTNPNHDFTKSYKKYVANGNAVFEYNPGGGALWWTSYASAKTGFFMPYNGIGYLAATIVTIDGSVMHTYYPISAASGGWNYCDWATVKGQKYAKRVEHYADYRSSSNVIVNIYTYKVQ